MHTILGLLNLVQITSGYILMLIFMTYNLYLCLSVIIGSGLGYFVFNPFLTRRYKIVRKPDDLACRSEEQGALLGAEDQSQPSMTNSLNTGVSATSQSVTIHAATIH